MDFKLGGVFNASNECASATNPMLRLFTATSNTSAVPLFELSAPPSTWWSNGSGWVAASPESACGAKWQTSLSRGAGFSAACFIYAQELQETLKVPVGAIDASWGGTNIEAWMSRQAMQACPNHTDPGPSEVPTPSLLYNAMIQPFSPMTIKTFLWCVSTTVLGDTALVLFFL
jgi:sialate O-acetylesterase